MNFTAGCVYYRVTYLDAGMTRPVVQSFVFLGKNLSDEDAHEDAWYFQESSDFHKHGSALTAPTAGTPVACLTSDALSGDMFDVEQLRNELQRVHQRCLEETGDRGNAESRVG